MSRDRSELHDLSTKHREKVAELSAKWEAWAVRANVKPWPWKFGGMIESDMEKDVHHENGESAPCGFPYRSHTAGSSWASGNTNYSGQRHPQVELGRHGLEKIHDATIDRTVEFATDRFSLRVDGREIESSELAPVVHKENDSVATCTFRSGGRLRPRGV